LRRKTILLYGRSRAGKSALIGELAKHLYINTGKKTRVYHIDNGGFDVLEPHIQNGFVEVVEQMNSDPWVFLNNAVAGRVRDSAGRWEASKLDDLGLIAFEGITAFCDAFMTNLAGQAATGLNVGGQASVSFNVNGDGQTLKIGGNNMSHYNIVQNRITKEVWASQKLQVPYILWTASASKDDDQLNNGKVLGPAAAGKALTSEIPRWFQYTFRVDAVPAQMGKPERHILYLGMSTDSTAGKAVPQRNARVHIGEDLPPTFEPASLVGALKLISDGETKAKEAMEKEIKGIGKSVMSGA